MNVITPTRFHARHTAHIHSRSLFPFEPHAYHDKDEQTCDDSSFPLIQNPQTGNGGHHHEEQSKNMMQVLDKQQRLQEGRLAVDWQVEHGEIEETCGDATAGGIV